MRNFKKFFNLIYSILTFILNYFQIKKFKQTYKHSILINDSLPFSDIKSKKLKSNNDICNQFDNLFYEIISHKPKVILELGVRNGQSTYVFNKIQKLLKNILISVDIDDCSDVISDPNWLFIQEDSIKFLQNFDSWSKENINSLKPDVIFIDSSHLFEETIKEIKSSIEIISKNGSIIFHDTNHRYVNFLENNIIYNKFNFKPQLGVKLALEDYFGCKFNFKKSFIIIKNGWLIKHYSTSFGLTIIRKL